MHLRVSGCSTSFKFREQLRRHHKKAHGILKLQKSKCSVAVENGFKCMKCNKLFAFESNVYRHYKTCSEKKVVSSSGTEYYCTVCNKCFTKKFNLKRHEATHSSNKECYQCKNCLKEYNREDF